MRLETSHPAARQRTRHCPRGLRSILAFGVLLTGDLTAGTRAAAPPAAGSVRFERSEIVTGNTNRQTVLSGFLRGGSMAELIVIHVDENDDRRLRVYGFGGGAWVPVLDTTLRPDVLFVDVANIGGRDRLITYRRGLLNWFDPESETERTLATVTSGYRPPPRGDVPHVDISRDVNGDDRDDLVVPGFDGFRVFVQLSDGSFADPVKLGRARHRDRIYGADGYRHDPWSHSRVHEMDYDLDGRADLVFWNEDHFEVHLQDEQGLFDPVPETFTTEVPFDSDEIASLASGDMKGRVLHSLADLNDDGVGDMLVYSLEGANLFTKHSTYEMHFGAPTADGGTEFAKEVGAAIRSRGIQVEMRRHDFNRDGQVDFMFTTVNLGLLKLVGALLTGSMPLDLELYRMENGGYPRKPNAIRKIKPEFPPVESGNKDALYPAVLLGDVNGDGRSELLVGKNRKVMLVFSGVEGPHLFARKPLELTVDLPDDEEYTWLVDLDGDDRQDILIHHPATTERQRVTVLLAR